MDRWVRTHGVDPYGATPFRLGPGSRDSAVYVQAGGDHLTTIARFGPAPQAAIIATLRRWAGVPATVAAQAISAVPGRCASVTRLADDEDRAGPGRAGPSRVHQPGAGRRAAR